MLINKSFNTTLFVILIFMTGCIFESDDTEYVSGQVVAGIRNNVSLETLADYIYTLENVSIKSVAKFQYYSTLAQDSLLAIQQAFESKSYIDTRTINIVYNEDEDRLDIDFWVNDFCNEDRSDWTSLINRFDLQHISFDFQGGLFSVEIGKEKSCITKFLLSGYFKFAELNYVVHGCD